MNPFQSRLSSSNSWLLPVCLLAVALGFMIRLSWITQDARRTATGRLNPLQGNRLLTGDLAQIEKYTELIEEVQRLRAENGKLQNSLFNEDSRGKLANQLLQNTKLVAALSPVKGPGVSITLTDAPKSPTPDGVTLDQIIHDIDVLKVINELWASGAEAISVNNHRIGPTTAIRCVGPTIQIGGVPIAAPIVIRAIGNPEVLEGGMQLPGGVLEEIRSTDPNMVKVERMKEMSVPAFSGPTTWKFAKAAAAESEGGAN